MNNKKGGGQKKDNASSQWGRVPLHTVVVTQLPAGWNRIKPPPSPGGSGPDARRSLRAGKGCGVIGLSTWGQYLGRKSSLQIWKPEPDVQSERGTPKLTQREEQGKKQMMKR